MHYPDLIEENRRENAPLYIFIYFIYFIFYNFFFLIPCFHCPVAPRGQYAGNSALMSVAPPLRCPAAPRGHIRR